MKVLPSKLLEIRYVDIIWKLLQRHQVPYGPQIPEYKKSFSCQFYWDDDYDHLIIIKGKAAYSIKMKDFTTSLVQYFNVDKRLYNVRFFTKEHQQILEALTDDLNELFDWRS